MDPTRAERIRFRAWRRGFREADLILGPFADQHARTLGDAEADDLERLMEQADQDLYDWIIERQPTPAEFDTPMMRRLKAFRMEVFAVRTDLGG